MTEQRYRPLAEGEVIEEGDQYHWDGDWFTTLDAGRTQTKHGMKRRRPIPETAWRGPVGDVGYPYPPGTVVELEHRDPVPDCVLTFFVMKGGVKFLSVVPGGNGDATKGLPNFGGGLRHRVIDYRPDLLDEKQNNVGSEGTGIHGEEGQPETDPRDQSDEPCRSCHAELTRLRAERDEDLQLIDKLQKELSKTLHDKNEMTTENERLRAQHGEAMCLITQTTRERDGWKDEAERAQRNYADASSELSALRAATKGDVWYHQGDGHDEPESLTCRVVMDADGYREFCRLRAEVERLELRESVLMATVDKLETELQMWRGAADDRRGFVVRPKVDPMF